MSEESARAETSIGQVDVVFGWNNWVTVSVPVGFGERRRAERQLTRATDLRRLLADMGIPESEADPVARGLWKQRPRSASAGEIDPWEPFWKRYPNGTLVVFLLFLAGVLVITVVFRFHIF